jgi:hypothetical protein
MFVGDDGFGRDLKEFSKSNKAKVEFLLKSLPPFYANIVENIRAKDHEYNDVARKLKEYILQRQKGQKKEGTQESPIVLKTEGQKDRNNNDKKCNYCIDTKGWKGIGRISALLISSQPAAVAFSPAISFAILTLA